jgi:hypothetical protein
MAQSVSSKLYVLDALCTVIPCEEEQAWTAFMANPANTVILETRVAHARSTVKTHFLGQNHGTPELPVFFDTLIVPHQVNIIRDAVPMVYAHSPTWALALANHDKAINYCRRMA